jgi:hypothetical protein
MPDEPTRVNAVSALIDWVRSFWGRALLCAIGVAAIVAGGIAEDWTLGLVLL